MHVKELREILQSHDFVLLEINRAHKHGILNILHFLLNVRSVLKDTYLLFFKGINASVAILDILRDRQREPVMVALTLVHRAVERSDLVLEELLLDGSHTGHSLIIRAQELHELVNVLHVVFFLQGDVDNRVGDPLADAVEELGLTNDDLKLRVEVNTVALVVSIADGLQDGLGEHIDGVTGVIRRPFIKELITVVLGEHLGDADVVFGGLNTKRVLGEDLGLGLKLINRRLDASNDGTSPADRTRSGRHILGNWRVFMVHLEELLHVVDLIVVSTHDKLVLILEASLNGLASLDVLELGKKVKRALR
jgi:hypothetical protein